MKIELFTLKQLIKNCMRFCPTAIPDNFSHIKYDPLLDEDNELSIDDKAPKKHCEFWIIRQQKSDGTLLFTMELINEVFFRLVNGQCNYLLRAYDVFYGYRIGRMKLEISWCDDVNNHGIILHTQEKIQIPVHVIYEPFDGGKEFIPQKDS